MALADIGVRAASPADLDAITGFHVRLWRDTYRDLAPPDAHAALDESRRRPGWQAKLAESGPGNRTLLAISHNRIAGLVCLGPAGHSALQPGGEIHHLYVDPEYERRGIGRHLLALALDELRTAGHDRAALAVVAGNRPARAFYRALGGVEAGRFTDPGPLWRSDNIIVQWPLH